MNRNIFVADARRGDGKCYVVRGDEHWRLWAPSWRSIEKLPSHFDARALILIWTNQ